MADFVSSGNGAGPSNYHNQASASAAYAFPSPVKPWPTSYTEWKAEEELKQNVASMFNFVQPKVQRFRDEQSIQTDRAFMLDSSDDDDSSGAQTPRPEPTWWEKRVEEQQQIDDACNRTQWPEDQESRPTTPRPFSAERPDEMAFLSKCDGVGTASVTYLKDDGTRDRVDLLHRERMTETCELIGFVFEAESRPGSDRCHLDMLTERTARPFVRFLHIESYALNDEAGNNVYDDAPTSLLIHIELCRLGKYFDLPKLVNQSYVNIQRQCEFSCSSPKKPIDLEPAILYLYQYQKDFSEHFERIMETFTNYCIACFYDNRLGADVEFKKLAMENNGFYLRLYENSMSRSDGPEVTPGIVRLPYEDLPALERPSQNGKAPAVVSASTNAQIAQHFDAIKKLINKQSESRALTAQEIQAAWDLPHSPRKRRAGSDTLKAVEEQEEEEDKVEEEEQRETVPNYSKHLRILNQQMNVRYTSPTREEVEEDEWVDALSIRKQLRVTNSDPAREDESTESEFEAVGRPVDGIVALSSAENTDAESDWEAVERESPPRVRFAEQALPLRGHPQGTSSIPAASNASASTVAPVADRNGSSAIDADESDSEWSVVSGG